MFLGSQKLRFSLRVDNCSASLDVQVSNFGKFTGTHDLFAGMATGCKNHLAAAALVAAAAAAVLN
jgi:hypothetical protein